MNARSRGEYVARVAKAAAERLTGTFEVSAGTRWSRLHLQRGEPIWVETSEEARSLGPDLVRRAVVDEGDLARVTAEQDASRGLQASIEAADVSDPDVLRTACVAWLEAAIAEPLSWGAAELKFEERETPPILALREAIGGEVSLRRALWRGVQRHVELNDVLMSVIDPAAGPLHPTLGLWTAMDEMEIEEPYTQLPEQLGSGLTVDELLGKIPDRSGLLMKLIWTLERLELLDRPRAARPRPKTDPRGRVPTPPAPDRLTTERPPKAAPLAEPSTDASPDFSWWTAGRAKGVDPGDSGDVVTPAEPVEIAPPPRRSTSPGTLGPSSGSTPVADLEGLIDTTYSERMGRDYYTFLKIPKKAPARQVERACRTLLRRWNLMTRRTDLSPTTQKQVEELIGSLQLVYRTLGRPDRKAEYDRRVDRGSPPVVGEIRAASASALKETAAALKARGGASTGDLLAAMREMESGNWERALGILRSLRVKNPSDPDVLAELGWCTHNHSSAAGDPEEYLLLATTFDANHPKALEYLARIALDQGDTEGARRRLTRLTKLDRGHRWARRTLRNLPPSPE